MNEHILNLIRGAKHTFDYSEVNMAYYPKDIEAKVSLLMPPVVEWSDIKTTKKKYDILFCGYKNPRREKILNELKEAGFNVLHVTNVFGKELTKLINESHIYLNLHYGESKSLETCRLNEAVMSPDTHIISEKSGLVKVDKLYESRVIFTEKEVIVKTVKDVLNKGEEILGVFDMNNTNIKLRKILCRINTNANALKKISIVMAYYNRKIQLLATLDKFEELYGNKYNMEVIIVDDKSDENNMLDNDYIQKYSFQIKYIKLLEKTWINPVVAYNVGFMNISSDTDYVIIQNPEIYHCANIVEHFIEKLHDNEYYTYPVFSSPNFKENENLYKIKDNYFENFINKIDYTKYDFDYSYYINKYKDIKYLNESQAYRHFLTVGLKENRSCNIENCFYREDTIYKWKGWYNHVTLNNRNLHFLSVVKYNTLQKVGGFCNEMKDGLWYDDNDFVYRMSQVAKVHTIDSNKYIGIHQFHISGSDDQHIHKHVNDLVNNNKIIYEDNIKKNVIYCSPQNNNNIEKKILENHVKISIVTAYFNDRKEQTINTLNGFEKMYAGKYRFEVIIVDDNSDTENKLDKVITKYSYPINLIIIIEEEKGDRVNPCIAYNRGFKEAKGEIIIIQNPECYHVGDILKHTIDNLTEQDYFSYSCYASNSYNINEELLESNNVYNLINDKDFKNKNCFDVKTGREILEWYNHPTINNRNTAYHFCSSIHKSKLSLIGGFDERFKDGYCFDDDELLLTLKYNLNLNIQIIDIVNCFVIHQFHKLNISNGVDRKNENDNIKEKWVKNKNLYEEIKTTHSKYNFCFPKLLHLYWDGSPLSYLNLLTIISFNEYNKNWKIIVYMPTHKTETMSWESHEQKLKYNNKCYIYKLYDIPNVIIQKICLDSIGFDNNASEVIKSDYFRYYILHKHGGIWSDFDIIYTGSIEKKMNFKEDNVIFKCFSFTDPKQKQKSTGYIYYPIGFFMSKPNSKFFKYILNQCKFYYNRNNYQCIGATMWSKLFVTDDSIYKLDKSINICNEEYYLPWAWNELDQFLDIQHNILPNNNIGIHWFNGADKSKQYAINLENRLSNFKPICYLDYVIQQYVVKDKVNYINTVIYDNDKLFCKKVSIVMAYYNRKEQLIQTLASIKQSSYKNIEIIIVDDNSDKTQRVNTFIDDVKGELNIKVITIESQDKTWVNPCIPYNIGFKEATGDIIIIQNPEVMHVGDCILTIVNNIKENDWISFNCYGSPSFDYNYSLINKTSDEVYKLILNSTYRIGGNSVKRDDVGGWLNHHDKHFVAYHYLSAIHKTDLINKMNGGFNEIFKNGIGADDDEFIKRLIYNKFNFKINEFKEHEPFAIHQFHEKPNALRTIDFNINKNIFKDCCIKMNLTPENNIVLVPENESPMARRIII